MKYVFLRPLPEIKITYPKNALGKADLIPDQEGSFCFRLPDKANQGGKES